MTSKSNVVVLFVAVKARLFAQAPLPTAVKVMPGPDDVAVTSAFVPTTPPPITTTLPFGVAGTPPNKIP